jgi:hypothetical protein
MSIEAKRVINGNWGQVWLDSDLVAECTSLQAKVTLTKTDVNFCGDMWKKQKVVGLEGKGTLKMNKISSRMLIKLKDDIAAGKQTVCTINTSLADPDSFGTEKITITGVTFDELTLIDFEVKKNIEESIPFTFTGYDVPDLIEVQ